MSEAVSIHATPKEYQLVEHDGQTFRTIREGLAYILVPPNTQVAVDPLAKKKAENDSNQQAQNVFYNPIQQFNRDLSVLAIKAFGEDACERRRLKHEKNKDHNAAKNQRKKNLKRQRNGELKEEPVAKVAKTDHNEAKVEDEDEGGVRLDGYTDTEKVATTRAPTAGQAVNGVIEPVTISSSTLPLTEAPADSIPNTATILDTARSASEAQIVAPANQIYQPPFSILDALSATGLRALRYAKEIPFATRITANDMSRDAVKSIELHIKHNDVASKVKATTSNAMAHMYAVAHPPIDSHGPQHISGKYDVIDLDPYGTAAPFIDASLQALNDGGLLCVTCTDSGVFASCGYSEKAFSLYGGLPVKGLHCHEAGLRLIINSVASAAAKYGISIEPLLSLSIDFYARCFIRIRKSPADVKFLSGKTMLVYECDSGCGAWTPQMIGRNTKTEGKNNTTFWKHTIAQAPTADRSCEHCGFKRHVAGPMWAGPIHNAAFVEKVLGLAGQADRNTYATIPRIEGMLNTALDELFVTEYKEKEVSDHLIPQVAPDSLDTMPFFFIPSALAKVVHCQSPNEAAIKGALRHAGYRVTRSHCKPGSVKTNAPWSVIWEVMREWIRQKSPINEEKIRPGTAGFKVLGMDKQAAKRDETAPKVVAQPEDTTTTSEKPSAEQVSACGNGVRTGGEKLEVVFDEALGRDKAGKKLVRYQVNPRENWGPMVRAK